MTAVPRVVLSAPSAGHGKTAISAGMLAAFAARGLHPAAFKIGPESADAAYLGRAAGRPGRNLDPQLVGMERIPALFAHGAAGAGIAVVEGTMGLYDCVIGQPETESTAALATVLRSPVVLVLDVAAMGQSVAALVHGFRAYDELVWLGGVILDRVASDRHEELLREALDDIGVPIFGVLHRNDLPATLPGREYAPHESTEAAQAVRRLGEVVAARLDVDGLLALAASAPPLPVEPWSPYAEVNGARPADGRPVDTRLVDSRPIVAVVGGPNSGYSYPETVELLTVAGAQVATVDPLRDEKLPPAAAALVVGGGLPETYARQLSANRELCAAVAELARSGAPVLAEGAGLLWLARELDGQRMCGVLEATGVSQDVPVVGYRTATARTASVLAPAGTVVTGYKRHRTVFTPRAGRHPAWNWPGGAPEGHVWGGVYASQLVVHWAGVPGIAGRLVTAAAAVAERSEVKV